MKQIKSIISCVFLALVSLGASSARAEKMYDWETSGSYAIGKTAKITMPDAEEAYYTLSGLSKGQEYTITASGSGVEVEVVYTHDETYEWEGSRVTDTYADTLAECSSSTETLACCFVDEDVWIDLPEDESGKQITPKGYYLHVYGAAGETITVTSSKGIVEPPKTGTLTVRIKGSDSATWSLKSAPKTLHADGDTITISGEETIVFSTVKGLTKPANITVEPEEDGEAIEKTGVYGVTLTLKGTDVTAEYDGEEKTGSFTVVPGDEVLLRALETYESKNVGYVFQCWTPAKAYDFGEGYSAASPETTIAMPSAALTMTATYLKESEAAYMTMYATGEPVTIGEETIEPAEGDLLWSPDGKTWYACGTRVMVKKGIYTVQWKSASGSWAGPAKTKVTVPAGEEHPYSNEDDPAVFTFVTVLCAEPVVYEDGELSESSEGGEGGAVTMKPANGIISASGTTFTLTAKANKGYAFVGWQWKTYAEEAGIGYSSASATVKMTLYSEDMTEYLDKEDHQVHYQAVFRPISDYTEESVARAFQTVSVGSRAIEPTYDEEGFEGSVTVSVGLNCAAFVSLDCASEAKPLTFKLAKGTLPKGLKFDATSGYLSGTPTAAGTYPLTVTATDPAGHVCTLALTVVVRSVFDPIVGDWRALLTDDEGLSAGLFEMSITEKGKASAKVITVSGTTSVTPTVTWTEDEEDPDADGTFTIYYGKSTGNAKSGTFVFLNVGTGEEPAVLFQSSTWKNGETTSEVSLSGTPVRADSSWFTDATFAAAFLGKYYTVALTAEEGDVVEGYRTPSELMAPGYLTLTTDKKGAVKVAGKLADGEKVSASAILLPATNGLSASALVFVAPSGYKKKGSVALQLDFDSNGNVVSSIGSWVTPPLLDAIAGVESEDEVFLPGMLSLAASGAVYSKLDNLTGYYLSLAVSAGDAAPTLEFSYTDGEKQKAYGEAGLALSEYSLDSESGMLTGGMSGKITVAKSPTPWKDSDGEWHYDETKEDSYGETQPITNPGSLTIAFKPATGIFSGKFNLFFDYEVPQYKSGEEIDPKKEHKSVSCSYEGVLVRGADEDFGTGSAVYSGKYTYQYETTAGKAATKTYTQKYALPVNWQLGEE